MFCHMILSLELSSLRAFKRKLISPIRRENQIDIILNARTRIVEIELRTNTGYLNKVRTVRRNVIFVQNTR